MESESGKELSEQELVGPSGKQIEAPDTAIHDDSGHESNMSTPDAPSTPHEGERSITPGIFNEYLRGDILYLVVETMEERRFHITCCSRGFYVNSTTDAAFNPEPSTAYHRGGVFHSLFDLLSELSPQFRQVFPQLLKARAEKHVYERLPKPCQTYSWIAPSLEASSTNMGITPHYWSMLCSGISLLVNNSGIIASEEQDKLWHLRLANNQCIIIIRAGEFKNDAEEQEAKRKVCASKNSEAARVALEEVIREGRAVFPPLPRMFIIIYVDNEALKAVRLKWDRIKTIPGTETMRSRELKMNKLLVIGGPMSDDLHDQMKEKVLRPQILPATDIHERFLNALKFSQQNHKCTGGFARLVSLEYVDGDVQKYEGLTPLLSDNEKTLFYSKHYVAWHDPETGEQTCTPKMKGDPNGKTFQYTDLLSNLAERIV
ncbi:clustered mitochondria protein like protein [Ditylenchus destructor]|uniref:Clustered mitochondria protein like protein n=1 Tax=Ditylenchus destructor TaxID=166010 RepID=A0AAD4MHI6_9BILA|nr:clustered mitochondria protein like protein [Ditylenchus destructor]